jgi:hypothetical protein
VITITCNTCAAKLTGGHLEVIEHHRSSPATTLHYCWTPCLARALPDSVLTDALARAEHDTQQRREAVET